jgi:hypothetical protein
LNEQINKTVTCRVRRPEDWAGMMKQACQAESKTTEQFSVILPEVKEGKKKKKKKKKKKSSD